LQALGFKQKQVVVKSKQITPSWGLVPRLQGYDLIFSKTLTPEGLLEISYTTPKHSCRRCNSTGVENDLRWDEQGFIERVEGSNLLYQMVAKAVLTKVGSNPYHLKYGSNAFNLIGGKSNLGAATALRESVRQALTNLQRQQQLQKRLQTLSLEETLLQVEAINVSQIGDDATALVCNIIVRSASGTPVSVNLVFSVPGSTQINGELR
jgi:phage baseplate assembly protein W